MRIRVSEPAPYIAFNYNSRLLSLYYLVFNLIEEAIFKQVKKMLRDKYLEAKTLKDNNKIINII